MTNEYDEIIRAALAANPIVDEAARKAGLDGFDLIRRQMRQESGGNKAAESHKGARGLMQLVPATAASLGVTDIDDPEQNIHAGVTYLAEQLRRFGDLPVALAAYNAGPTAVRKYGGQVPPFPETQDYVQRILQATPEAPVVPPEQRAQVERRIRQVENVRALLPIATEAVSRGFMSPEEYKAAVNVQTEDGQPDYGRIGANLRFAANTAADRLRAAEAGQETTQLEAFSQAVVNRVMTTAIGALALGGKLSEYGINPMQGAVPPEVIKQGVERLQQQSPDALRKVQAAMFGTPEDPVEYELYKEQLPVLGQLTGELAAFMLTSYLLPAMKGSPTSGVLGRVLTPTKGNALLATGTMGVGALAGVALTPDDAPTTEKVMNALSGASLGYLGLSALRGAPYGTVARMLRLREIRNGVRGPGNFLAHMLSHPRTTFGNLSSIAIQGGVLGATDAAANGATAAEAIGHGAQEAGLFMLGDLAIARLGTGLKYANILTSYNRAIADRMIALRVPEGEKVVEASLARAVQWRAAGIQTAGDVALGALVGAGAAGEGNRMGGAVAGGTLALGVGGVRAFADVMSRYQSLLPRKSIEAIVSGEWGKLSPQELGELTGVIIDDAMREAAGQTDVVMNDLIRRIAGRLGISDEEYVQILRQRALGDVQFMARNPGESLEATPELLQFLHRQAALLERASQRATVVDTDAETIVGRVLTSSPYSLRTGRPFTSRLPEPRIVRGDAQYLDDISRAAPRAPGEAAAHTGAAIERAQAAVDAGGVNLRGDVPAPGVPRTTAATVMPPVSEARAVPPDEVLRRMREIRAGVQGALERGRAADKPEAERFLADLDGILNHPDNVTLATTGRGDTTRALLESLERRYEQVINTPKRRFKDIARDEAVEAEQRLGVELFEEEMRQSGVKPESLLRAFGLDPRSEAGAVLARGRRGGPTVRLPVTEEQLATVPPVLQKAREFAEANGFRIHAEMVDGVPRIIAEFGGRRIAEADTVRDLLRQLRQATKQGRRYGNMRAQVEGLLRSSGRERIEDLSFRELAAIAGERGFALTLRRGRTYAIKAGKQVVAEAKTIPELLDAIERLAGQRGASSPEALMGLGSGLVGGSFGWFAGPVIQSYFDPEADNTALGAFGGALLFGTLAAVVSMRGAGVAMSRQAERLARRGAKFFEVSEGALERDVAEAFVNGGSTVPKAVRDKVGNVSPEQLFVRLSHTDQVRYLKNRVSATLARANLSTEEKQIEVSRLISKYAPTAWSIKTFDEIVPQIIDALTQTGMDETKAWTVVRGMLAKAAVPPAKRLANRAKLDLMALGRDPTLLPPGEGEEALRKIVEAASVVTGPEAAVPSFARRAFSDNLRKLVSPVTEEYRKIVALADQGSLTPEGSLFSRVGTRQVTLMGRFLPPFEQFSRLAQNMELAGNKQGAKEVRQFVESMRRVTTSIENEWQDAERTLHRIFHNISYEERLQVKSILQDASVRARVQVENPRLYEAATAFGKLLREFADRAGMPEDLALDDYFPWIYTEKTIRELRRKGIVPGLDDMVVPIIERIPEIKVSRNLLERTSKVQLGETLEDPLLEVGPMYLRGMIRKIHLDDFATNFNYSFYERLIGMHGQPHLARDLARWQMDVWGYPSAKYARAADFLAKIGVNLERLSAEVSTSSWIGKAIQEYGLDTADFLQNHDALRRLTNLARGFEFYTKVGPNPVSALINLTQLGNSAADLGISALLTGGLRTSARAMQGQFAEAAAARNWKSIATWIDPEGKGLAKLALVRQYGAFNKASSRFLEAVSRGELSEARGVGLTVGGTLVGGAAGTVAGTVAFEDSPTGVYGAAAGLALSLGAPRVMRTVLSQLKHRLTFFFDMSEAVVRSATAGAADDVFERAMAVQEGTISKATARGREIGEGALEGALVGGALAASLADEDKLQAGLAGALVGAPLGAALSAGEPRYQRVMREIEQGRDVIRGMPGFRSLVQADMETITREDVKSWWVNAVVDRTQFRLDRAGRPEALRTPTGEILGALQTFTLNQMEFTGRRFQEFFVSATRPGATLNGLDLRFFRHMYLTAGMSGALALLAGGMGSDRGTGYWAGRIGFGLMPFMRYNEQTGWRLEDVRSQVMGPFVDDIVHAFEVAWRLGIDPVARSRFDEQMDDLATGTVSAFRVIQELDDTVAATAETLGLEGIQDMIESQRGRTLRDVGERPVSSQFNP